MPDKTLTQNIFERYRSAFPDAVSSYDNFQKGMNEDATKRKAVYDYLRNDGYLDDTWDYDSFTSGLSKDYAPVLQRKASVQKAVDNLTNPNNNPLKKYSDNVVQTQEPKQVSDPNDPYLQSLAQGLADRQEELNRFVERATSKKKESKHLDNLYHTQRLLEKEKEDWESKYGKLDDQDNVAGYWTGDKSSIDKKLSDVNSEIEKELKKLSPPDRQANMEKFMKWYNSSDDRFREQMLQDAGVRNAKKDYFKRNNIPTLEDKPSELDYKAIYNESKEILDIIRPVDFYTTIAVENQGAQVKEYGQRTKNVQLEEFILRASDLAMELEKVRRGEKSGLGTGLSQQLNFIDKLFKPADFVALAEIAKRKANGENISQREETALAVYLDSEALQAKVREESKGYGTGSTIGGALSFLAEMSLTNPVAGLTREVLSQGVRKATTEAIEKTLKRQALNLIKNDIKTGMKMALKSAPSVAAGELARAPLMPSTQEHIAQNILGLYDLGFDTNQTGDGLSYDTVSERNDKTMFGAVARPIVGTAAMNTVFGLYEPLTTPVFNAARKSLQGQKILRNVLKKTSELTQNPIYKDYIKHLNISGLGTPFIQMPTADAIAGIITLDEERLKGLFTKDYWRDIATISLFFGGMHAATGLTTQQLFKRGNLLERSYEDNIAKFAKMEFADPDITKIQGKVIKMLRERDFFDKQGSTERSEIARLSKEIAQKYKGSKSEEASLFAETMVDLISQGVYTFGNMKALEARVVEEMGEFENRTADGRFVTIVRSRDNGNLYFLLDNKGDVSIVRGMTTHEQPFDIKSNSYDVISSVPMEKFIGDVATIGMQGAVGIEGTKGLRNETIQDYNSETYNNYRQERAPRTAPERQLSERNVERTVGQSAGRPAEQPIEPTRERAEQPIEPSELVPTETTPQEQQPIQPTEQVARPQTTTKIRKGATIELENGKVAEIVDIAQDGTVSLMGADGEIEYRDIRQLQQMMTERVTPEGTVPEEPATPISDVVQPTPQVPEPLPMKDGMVDYDTLVQTDPARFVQEYDREFGQGSGAEAIIELASKAREDLDKLQKKLQKANSLNDKAQIRREIAQVEQRLQTYESLLAPKEEVPTDVAPERPVEPVAEQPTESVVEQPAEEVVERPVEPAVEQPVEEVRPTEAAQMEEVQPIERQPLTDKQGNPIEEQEIEQHRAEVLSELESFAKETSQNRNIVADEKNFEYDYLYLPLLLDGEKSRLGVIILEPDDILDEPVIRATYEYSYEIDRNTNEGWQKWDDYLEEYNKAHNDSEKGTADADAPMFYFKTVDAAEKFNDWLKTKDSSVFLQAIKPIGKGEFGDIYDQFRGDAQGAIKFLLQKKSGEALGALSHKDVGEIDLVWGKEGTGKSDGYGLAKLAKYHPEVLNKLQSILDDMEVVSRTPQRVQLESNRYQAAVRLTWNEQKKSWLLTAFEKKNSVSDNTTDTVGTPKGSENDTATSTNAVSSDKDNTQSSKNQISSKKDTKAVGSENSPILKVAQKERSGEELVKAVSTKVKNRFSLHNYTSKAEGTNENGVYHNPRTKRAEATDGTIYLSSSADYNKKYAGKIVVPRSKGKEFKGFTSWAMVNDAREVAGLVSVDLASLAKGLDQAGRVSRELTQLGSTTQAESYIILGKDKFGKDITFDASHLSKFVDAAVRFGITPEEISYVIADGDKFLLAQNGKAKIALKSIPEETRDSRAVIFDAENGRLQLSNELIGEAVALKDRAFAEGRYDIGETLQDTMLGQLGEQPRFMREGLFGERTELTQPEETAITEAITDRLKEGGIQVITDKAEGQRVLDAYYALEQMDGSLREEKAVERTLMGVHNISEDKLKKAIRQGGLVNPSLAVIDTDKGMHNEFGKISLIPKSSLIDSETGGNAGTFTGDAWTATYPDVKRMITRQGRQSIGRMAKDAAGGDAELERHLQHNLNNYAEGNTSRLHLLYLIQKGLHPEIKMKSTKHTHEEYEELMDIFPDGTPPRGELSKEQNDRLLDLMMRKFDADAEKKVSAISDSEKREKAKQFLIEMRREKISDEAGNLYFSQWENYYHDVMRDERTRQNPQPDWYDTDLAADYRVATEGMSEDYAKWKEELFSDGDFEEKLFAGFDRDGHSKYVPNTVENASRLMNKNSDTNAYDEGGLNATRSSLLKKMRTLSVIRKNKHLLQGKEVYEESQKEMSDELFDIIRQISDMQKISDNSFSNIDYAEARLQEAITKRNPIGYLNKEYGYDIDKDSELAGQIMNFIEEAKKLPVKYFETKFKRPVMLDEFAVAIVPETTSADVVQSLRDAGLDVRMYDASDHSTADENRRQVAMEAVRGREDIMFQKATTANDVEAVNVRFNEEIERLTEENAREVQLDCGMPSDVLLSCGVEVKPIRLYGAKLLSKAKKHGYQAKDIKDLPKTLQHPIAVFTGSHDGSFAILTDLQIGGNNVLASLTVGKGGHDVDFNIISSVYGKEGDNVIRWINNGKMLYVDKEKALGYISVSAPIAEAQSNQELDSAANIIKKFENPKLPSQILFKITDKVKLFQNSDGTNILGFTKDGKIYLDPTQVRADTPIHEYSHIWAEVMRKGNPTEWKNIENIFKTECKDIWERVKKDYPELKTDSEIADEVLAHYSGSRGRERIAEEMKNLREDKSLSGSFKMRALRALAKVQEVLSRFWRWVGEDLLHIHFKSAEEVADRVLYDLINKTDLNKVRNREEGQPMSQKKDSNLNKKRALETVSVTSNEVHQPTVVSSADGAKIVNNLDNLSNQLNNSSNRPTSFIGDVAKAIGAKQYGSGSQYATFETKNGQEVTIRLSNHNAKVSNFDNHGESDGISIVVSPKKNKGLINDGNAHIVEYFYDAIKLRRAEGKPLAEIVRSIQQSLFSGEFKDRTGLAERQEVNESEVSQIRFQKPLGSSAPEIIDNARERVESEIDVAKVERQAKMDIVSDELNKSFRKKVQSAQRAYDKQTTKSIVDLANELIKEESITPAGKAELKQLLNMAKSATGKETLTQNVDRLMDFMVNNQLKRAERIFGKLLKEKGTKLNASGVKVAGRLDVEAEYMMSTLKENLKTDRKALEELYEEWFENGVDNPTPKTEGKTLGLFYALKYRDVIDSQVAEQEFKASFENKKAELYQQYKSGQVPFKTYSEFLATSKDALRGIRLATLDRMNELNRWLASDVTQGRERARQFRQKEKERAEFIYHAANADLIGIPKTAQKKVDTPFLKEGFNHFTNFLISPLKSLEVLCRLFGRNDPYGEGNIYDLVLRPIVDASGKEWDSYKSTLDQLNQKLTSIFGKKTDWSDLSKYDKPKNGYDLTFIDDGEEVTHHLLPSELLYIYAVDKMEDARATLRTMRIDSSVIDGIKAHLDSVAPQLVEFVDWVQGEFLPTLRERYNKRYEETYGATMAQIDNYFPLRRIVQAKKNVEKEDVVKEASITANALKERVHNLNQIEVIGSNFFNILTDHIKDMEHWYAYAQIAKDVNTLLNYKDFQNKVKNMKSFLSNKNHDLYKSFETCCRIALGTYVPKSDSANKFVVQVSQGVTASKIAGRLFTALKQLLSFPSVIGQCALHTVVKNIVRSKNTLEWCFENSPLFRKRWEERRLGDIRLYADEGIFSRKLVQKIQKAGITPNAAVDLWTCGMILKSAFETKYKSFKKAGMSEKVARERALSDAEILFNSTQQSAERAFLSNVQIDRNVLSGMMSTFRTASFGYTRKGFTAIHNLARQIKLSSTGKVDEVIDQMAKQLQRKTNISKEEAIRFAKQRYNRAFLGNTITAWVYLYVMQFFWQLGGSAMSYMMGDDKRKDEIINDAIKKGVLTGATQGLAFGQIPELLLSRPDYMKGVQGALPLLPIFSDIEEMARLYSSDKYMFYNATANLAISTLVGFNPQTITDAVVAFNDAFDGDDDNLSKTQEGILFLSRVLQFPNSNIREYLAQIGMTREEALELTLKQLAERYAGYESKRRTGLFYLLENEDTRRAREEKFIKQFNKVADGLREKGSVSDKDMEVMNYINQTFKTNEKTLREIRKEATINLTESEVEQLIAMYSEHNEVKPMIKNLKKLVKALQESKDPKEEEVIQQMINEQRQIIYDRISKNE